MENIKQSIYPVYTKNDFSLELFIHSNNVANISRTIARCIQLSNVEIKQLYDAAICHDIGKSKIPESILYKKGVLSSKEWKVMKQHSIYSEILYSKMTNDHVSKTTSAIRHHHENWDGTGYPDKIGGEDIPLHSRIIRIADIFDAITRPRVYRPYIIENPLEVMEDMQEKEIDPYIFRKSKDAMNKLLNQ